MCVCNVKQKIYRVNRMNLTTLSLIFLFIILHYYILDLP
jgi:hypothetical protein